MRGSRLTSALGVLCASLAACGSGERAGNAAVSASPASVRTPCPVTHPNGRTPPGEQPSREHHGNGELWTAIPPDGRILATRDFVRPDGAIEIKFPWWGGRHAGSKLRIAGSSIDPPGRPLGAQISHGYTGAPHFWASGVIFSTEGCWRVKASAGHARLTVVVSVAKA
jgi:hypothetical protein